MTRRRSSTLLLVVAVAAGCGGSGARRAEPVQSTSSTSTPTAVPTSVTGPTTTTASSGKSPETTRAAAGVQSLTIPAQERAALRTAFLRAHPAYAPDQVEGPLAGSVYYAVDNSTATYWALATFSVPNTGTTDQPEVLSKKQGGAWDDLGDTGGNPCKVPAPVLAAWHYPGASC